MANWQVYNPRNQPRKDKLTLTIGLKGGFGLSPLAVEAIGRPREVVLLYDPDTYSIMIRPPRDSAEPRQSLTRDARKDGRHGGHVAGSGFCKRFEIAPRQVVRIEGHAEGDGVVFALPPEARPRQESPNGQRTMVGATA